MRVPRYDVGGLSLFSPLPPPPSTPRGKTHVFHVRAPGNDAGGSRWPRTILLAIAIAPRDCHADNPRMQSSRN